MKTIEKIFDKITKQIGYTSKEAYRIYFEAQKFQAISKIISGIIILMFIVLSLKWVLTWNLDELIKIISIVGIFFLAFTMFEEIKIILQELFIPKYTALNELIDDIRGD